MTMALIDGGVCAEEVEIPFPFDVPHKDTLGFAQRNRKGMIIVRAVLGLTLENILRRDRPTVLLTLRS